MITSGRVYRRDVISSADVPFCYELGGVAVDEAITLGDLKATLLRVARALLCEAADPAACPVSRPAHPVFPVTGPNCDSAPRQTAA